MPAWDSNCIGGYLVIQECKTVKQTLKQKDSEIMTSIHLVDYRDEQLGELQSCIMQWREQDAEGISTLCHPGDVPHRIYNGTRGRLPVSELVKIYEVNGEIQGFTLNQPFANGFDVFVKPDVGKGELRELLETAYQTTRQHKYSIGRQETAVNTDVDETDRLRQEIFRELGFTQGENWLNSALRDLSEPIAKPELLEGFVIRHSRMDDYEQLAAVHSGAFNSNWNAEVYRDEVMSKPGYAPEREMVVVAPDGRFAAFCIYWLDEVNKIGLFEPVGAHSDFQRKGLTRALMNQTLCLMKEQGMEQAEIGHETDNPASSNLYASVGFKLHRHVWGWSKA
jgi:GNAT superfamily N-acetyltransferase